MIRPIKITLNAAHPEVPLLEATTFVGSPSAVFVSGVPATVGLWRITSVKVVAHYPDDSATTVECAKGASGVWTATLPATATSGRVTHGFEILADGTDENGDAVTGYVLGFADFAVFTRDMTIDSGGTLYYMHYFDAAPASPKKGDVAPDGSGGLQLYNGTAWQPFTVVPPIQYPVTSVNGQTGAVTLDIPSVVAPSTSAADAGKAADAKATGDALAGKASTAILQSFASENQFVLILERDSSSGQILYVTEGGTGGDGPFIFNTYFANTATPTFRPCVIFGGPSGATLAYLNDLAPQFDESDSYGVGELVVYQLINGGSYLYKCTTAHTGAWNSSHFTRATVEDVLAIIRSALDDKAPLASPAFTGTPTAPTPTTGDNSTKVATTAFVKTAVDNAQPNLDYVMRVDPETGNIYYTTPDTNA